MDHASRNRGRNRFAGVGSPNRSVRRINDEIGDIEGGYAESIFLNKNDDFKCPVCLEYFRDPVVCKHGHSFCRECISRVLRTSNICPVDRAPISLECLSPVINLKNIINTQKVCCSSSTVSSSSQCDWVGCLQDLDKHLIECPEVIIGCQNYCIEQYFDEKWAINRWSGTESSLILELQRLMNVSEPNSVDALKRLYISRYIPSISCQWSGPRRELEEHKEHYCQYRILTCIACEQEYPVIVDDMHKIFCTMRNVKAVQFCVTFCPASDFCGIYIPNGEVQEGWPVYKKRKDGLYIILRYGSEWQIRHITKRYVDRPVAWMTLKGSDYHLHSSPYSWTCIDDGSRITDTEHMVSLLSYKTLCRLRKAKPILITVISGYNINISGIYIPIDLAWNQYPTYRYQNFELFMTGVADTSRDDLQWVIQTGDTIYATSQTFAVNTHTSSPNTSGREGGLDSAGGGEQEVLYPEYCTWTCPNALYAELRVTVDTSTEIVVIGSEEEDMTLTSNPIENLEQSEEVRNEMIGDDQSFLQNYYETYDSQEGNNLYTQNNILSQQIQHQQNSTSSAPIHDNISTSFSMSRLMRYHLGTSDLSDDSTSSEPSADLGPTLSSEMSTSMINNTVDLPSSVLTSIHTDSNRIPLGNRLSNSLPPSTRLRRSYTGAAQPLSQEQSTSIPSTIDLATDMERTRRQSSRHERSIIQPASRPASPIALSIRRYISRITERSSTMNASDPLFSAISTSQDRSSRPRSHFRLTSAELAQERFRRRSFTSDPMETVLEGSTSTNSNTARSTSTGVEHISLPNTASEGINAITNSTALGRRQRLSNNSQGEDPDNEFPPARRVRFLRSRSLNPSFHADIEE